MSTPSLVSRLSSTITMASAPSGKGAPVKLVVYPGAYHSFDNPDLSKELRVFGHWLKYDADATQRAVAEMHDFLAAQFAK